MGMCRVGLSYCMSYELLHIIMHDTIVGRTYLINFKRVL